MTPPPLAKPWRYGKVGGAAYHTIPYHARVLCTKPISQALWLNCGKRSDSTRGWVLGVPHT
jgi:hypothetical protein